MNGKKLMFLAPKDRQIMLLPTGGIKNFSPPGTYFLPPGCTGQVTQDVLTNGVLRGWLSRLAIGNFFENKEETQDVVAQPTPVEAFKKVDSSKAVRNLAHAKCH